MSRRTSFIPFTEIENFHLRSKNAQTSSSQSSGTSVQNLVPQTNIQKQKLTSNNLKKKLVYVDSISSLPKNFVILADDDVFRILKRIRTHYENIDEFKYKIKNTLMNMAHNLESGTIDNINGSINSKKKSSLPSFVNLGMKDVDLEIHEAEHLFEIFANIKDKDMFIFPVLECYNNNEFYCIFDKLVILRPLKITSILDEENMGKGQSIVRTEAGFLIKNLEKNKKIKAQNKAIIRKEPKSKRKSSNKYTAN